jgi:hypothetical protein
MGRRERSEERIEPERVVSISGEHRGSGLLLGGALSCGRRCRLLSSGRYRGLDLRLGPHLPRAAPAGGSGLRSWVLWSVSDSSGRGLRRRGHINSRGLDFSRRSCLDGLGDAGFSLRFS